MPIRRCCLVVFASVLSLAGGACATTGPHCAAGERAVVDERLYFGTQRPGGEVSAAEWTDFVEHAVAASFPDGFTTWPAQGRWRDGDGRIVREASHVLALVHPANGPGEAAVAALIAAYESRFDQQAVLRVRAPACTNL